MKRILLFLISAGLALAAQQSATPPATHSATLTWSDPNNPAGTTYTVYRAMGLCSGTPTFAKLASAVVGLTYTDTTVTPGNYCYAVTATFQGMESAQSPSALAPVPSFAPVGLNVTVQ
jgi:hypothetical protein